MAQIKPLQRILTLALAAGAAASLGAITLEEAKQLYELGDFAEALPALEEAAVKQPKNGALNQMAGIALYYTGKEKEAKKFLRLGQNESNLYLAQIAMHAYRFEEAEDYLDRYEAGFRKGRRGQAPTREDADEIRDQIERGRAMLDRVEMIEIIDSLDVDRETFFRAYRLAPSSGSIQASDFLPRGFEAADPTTVYVSENADNIYWAMPDANENFRIASSSLLADNSWERPVMFSEVLNEGGDANYPFLASDGVTLYYASTGENSLGGYDIFISRRDGDDFLQPQNLGMPYNSYANDYMMAIDEETGIGWWATDRNAAPDRLTIYVFKPSDLRNNYPVDQPDLIDRALITDYKATWKPGADYTALLKRVSDIRPGGKGKTDADREIRFAVPGRGVYTSAADFRSREARSLFADLRKLEADLSADQRRLSALRRSYAQGKTAVAPDILELESDVTTLRDAIRRLRNQIIQAETR